MTAKWEKSRQYCLLGEQDDLLEQRKLISVEHKEKI